MRLLIFISMLLPMAALIAQETGQDSTEAVMQAHRYFAADFFNKCWELMDKPVRTPAEDLEMVHLSHASRAHWQKVGTPDNWAVGEWQLSRVYSLLNRTEAGLVHAKESLRLCRENNIQGFNLGYAYEALARIYYLTGETTKASEYIELGKRAAQNVSNSDEKTYLLNDLNTILPNNKEKK